MMPQKDTKFLPIQEIANYSDEEKWFSSAIVFSPETENNHFDGCPPYIRIDDAEVLKRESLFFEVPAIVAYYGTYHAGYTMACQERKIKEGERQLANKIKSLLNL